MRRLILLGLALALAVSPASAQDFGTLRPAKPTPAARSRPEASPRPRPSPSPTPKTGGAIQGQQVVSGKKSGTPEHIARCYPDAKIDFQSGKTELTRDGENTLNSVIRQVETCHEKHVTLYGVALPDDNERVALDEQRIAVIKRKLIAAGVPEQNIDALEPHTVMQLDREQREALQGSIKVVFMAFVRN